MKERKGLFLFRRDLRIHDNIGFFHALDYCTTLYPIFIFTPEQVSSKNTFRSENAIQFMMESLHDLKKSLEGIQLNLSFFYGSSESVVKKLIKFLDIDIVLCNYDYSPYSKKRDNKIKSVCKDHNIMFETFYDYYLFTPYQITNGEGKAYMKFTPYYNKALTYIKDIPKPIYIKAKQAKQIKSKTIGEYSLKYKTNDSIAFHGGRKHAMKYMAQLSKFKTYGETRNTLTENTSHLSAYLKFGCVSVREVFTCMKEQLGLKSPLLRQLFWREFYACILFHYPHVLGKSMKLKYDNIKWDNKIAYFNAWKKGKTGFPLIDAGMRELNETGYMHNRSRLLTASFLVKTLLIDWQKGEKYFATKLIDYDPASNNGNWQWIAGSGADSQPYFRIFNPWKNEFDPKASYIKKWIPELKDVPAKDIYRWNEVCDSYKNIYVKPIVDYKDRRERVLKLYKDAL